MPDLEASIVDDLIDETLVVRPVLTTAPLSTALSYLAPPELPPGSLVEVPLGGRMAIGVIWDGVGDPNIDLAKLKSIRRRLEAPLLPQGLRRLIDWTAAYLVVPPGNVLRLSLPRTVLSPPPRKTVYQSAKSYPANARLTPQRKRILATLANVPPLPAVEAARLAGVGQQVVRAMAQAGLLNSHEVSSDDPAEVMTNFKKPALSSNQASAAEVLRQRVCASAFSVDLLDGVTGSGKTVVYMEAIAAALSMGRQTLCLVPEISLTDQWLKRFTDRFGAKPIIWHSELGGAARRRAWRAIADGSASVVVGARSATFLPFKNLGLIVIDEEHEAAYKQDDGVRYQARDIAVVRGRLEQASVVLASATPSLETLNNVQRGRYGRVELPSRHGVAVKPEVDLIDLRATPPERGFWLAQPMVESIEKTLSAGEQTLLFLNRRGYAPLTLCRSCGSRVECPSCSAWLVEHRLNGRLICHHCGFSKRFPNSCEDCGVEGQLTASGPGVERVAEEARNRWPKARIEIASSDTLSGPSAIQEFIRAMLEGEIDIAVGTQVLAKGHHFPNLTLVGIVDGDLGLGGGDLRAGERSFQLLTQASGRAGRAERPGRALIQTHQPDHSVMQALISGDRDAFIDAETTARKYTKLPPFGRLAAIIISGRDSAESERMARAIAKSAPNYDDVRILGPAPAPIAQLRGRWRWRLLVMAARHVDVQAVLRDWIGETISRGGVRVTIDVDPYNFM
ncbi:MAG: primosomal protein N' [Alphaproteobacteria bacterium]|jgi:primosomal protein N' (replication factor Y)